MLSPLRSGSPDQRPCAPDRGDDVKDRSSGGGGAFPVLDHRCVVGALDDAVDAVGRQGGQSVLLRRPAGGTSAAGRQDDQRLVGEVTQRCRLLHGGVPLDVLVDRAAEIACGRLADQAAQTEAG